MPPVVATLERSAAVDAREVGTLAAALVGVEFGLLDRVVAHFAGDCRSISDSVNAIGSEGVFQTHRRPYLQRVYGIKEGEGEVEWKTEVGVVFFLPSAAGRAARLCGLGGVWVRVRVRGPAVSGLRRATQAQARTARV